MSLKYRDKNGALTVLAGLTPGGNLEAGAVATRKGTTSVPSTSADSDVAVSVTFTDAMPDEDYEVNLHATAYFIIGRISNQTANGFTVTLRNTNSSSSSGSLDWYAFKTYSVAHAEQNASDIADIKTKIPSTASSSNKLATSNELSSLGTTIDGRLDALEDTIPSSASLQNQLITETGLTTALQGKQDTLTFDDTPTEDSSNPVTSDGIKDAIDDTAADIYEVMGKNGAKNLLPNNAATKTVNGITFTVNSDGSVTANGTATSTSYIILISSFNLVGGKYILSDEANSTDGNVQIILDTPDGSQRFAACYGATREKKFTLNQAYTLRSFIWIGSGITVDNVTFKPMIRLASDTDSTYQPYALTNQQITPYIQAVSNPNILDNGWFTINQRGESSYYGNIYGFDRWRSFVTDLTVSKTGEIVTLERGETSTLVGLLQYFEDINTFLGKTITISILLPDDSIISTTYKVPTTPDNTMYSICPIDGFGTIVVHFRETKPYIGIGSNVANASFSFKAIKLELGTVSTLAMDTKPNYQQELARCQRYFVRVSNASCVLGPINAWATNCVRAFIPLSVPLRTTPTITTNIEYLDRLGNIQDLIPIKSSATSVRSCNCLLSFVLTATDGTNPFTVGEKVAAISSNTTSGDPIYFDISADL